jgi:hypothetical protein
MIATASYNEAAMASVGARKQPLHDPEPVIRSPRLRAVTAMGWLVVSLAGCDALVPLRDPPALATGDPVRGAATRDQVVSRLGDPLEVRATDTGQVLVYRRAVAVSADPSRYYGQDRGDRLVRYERVLVYLDEDGRVARWTTELE